MKHLPVGGSTAPRTIHCPAWLERSKDIPKPKSGVAADKGNLLHDAMELHYKNGVAFAQLVGQLTYADQRLTAEDVEEFLLPAQYATEAVLDKYDIDELLLEPFVQYIEDEVGGSIDMLARSYDRKTVLVLDYKFGARFVSIETEQLPFYGLCASVDPKTAYLFEEAERIVFAIVQPARGAEAALAEHPIKVLAEFEKNLVDALEHPERSSTGKHCDFCPAAPVCPDKIAKAKSALVLTPKTAEETAQAVELADELDKWVKQIKQQAYDIAMDGGVIPRHKLVAGRASRKWKPQADFELRRVLGDEAFETKLLGVTKIEKLLGKEALEALDVTELSQNKPSLVNEDAPGEPLVIKESENLIKMFDKNLNKD